MNSRRPMHTTRITSRPLSDSTTNGWMSSWSIPISELFADGVQVANLDLREFFQQLLVFPKSFFHHLFQLFVTDRSVDLFLLSSILFLDHSRITPYPLRGSAKFLATPFFRATKPC